LALEQVKKVRLLNRDDPSLAHHRDDALMLSSFYGLQSLLSSAFNQPKYASGLIVRQALQAIGGQSFEGRNY
jgi:hypothetical protein